MRLIDADAFLDWIDVGHLRNPGEVCFCEADVAHMIKSRPTIDPIHAAGGCYCRECRYYDEFDCPASSNGYTYLWVKYCGYGKPKEAQGDG